MSLLPSRPEAEPAEDAGPRVIGVDTDDADDVLSALSSGTARRLLSELHEDPAPPSELADRVDTSLQNAQYHLEKLQNAGAVEVVDTAYSAKGREMDVFAPADQPLVIFAGDEGKGSTLRTALSRLLGALGILGFASLAIQALFGRGGLFGGPATFGTGGESGAPAADGGAGGAADGEDGAFDVTATPSGGDGDGGQIATPEKTATAGGDGGDGGGVSGTMEARDVGTDTATPMPEPTGQPSPSPAETGAPTPAPEPTPVETAMPTPTADQAEFAGEVTRTTAEAAGGGGGLPPGLVFFAGGLFVLAVVALVLYTRQP